MLLRFTNRKLWPAPFHAAEVASPSESYRQTFKNERVPLPVAVNTALHCEGNTATAELVVVAGELPNSSTSYNQYGSFLGMILWKSLSDESLCAVVIHVGQENNSQKENSKAMSCKTAVLLLLFSSPSV